MSTITAFQGPRPTHELTGGRRPARAPLPPRARLPGEEPLLDPVAARVATTLMLVAFGSLHWMMMRSPTQSGRALDAIGLSALTVVALLGARRLGGWRRTTALAAIVVGGLALAFIAGGVAPGDLRPRNWGTVADTINGGVSALPGARIPYAGLDEQLQLVIPLGGMVCAFVGTLAACWPRRDGRLGVTVVALVLLVTLYAVPAIALILGAEFFRGAVMTLLVVAFLRLHRLRRRDAPGAGAVAGATVVLALILAPALDSPDPWWNYEDWAQTAAGARSETFSWEHDYAALAWPRDGRELLMIQSRQRAYWKADQLDVFDGREWVHDRFYNGHDTPGAQFEGIPVDRLQRWSFPIKVTLRNLRSDTLPIAGAAEEIAMPDKTPVQVRAGVWSVGRSVRRGDAYTARVYLPQPSAGDLEQAGTAYPYDLERYTSLIALTRDGSVPPQPVRFYSNGFFGVQPTLVEGPDRSAVPAIEASSLRRAYELSRRLLGGAATPYEYVKSVQRYLEDGFSYSEAPPAASRTLDGFLFKSKVGFCQQFSGAMTLMLRLAGIPARVATGFAPGSYDRRHKAYVVRDVDAHSWVEAWFPGIGWVTFDPTPAAAPPRSQALLSAPSAARGDQRDIGTTQADPLAPAAKLQEPRPWPLYGLAAVAVAGVLWGLRGLWRRRGRPRPAPLSELERALRGAGEPMTPGVTLSALRHRFAGSPAEGYVAALEAQRYGGAGSGPTAAQRRGLRRALSRRRGPLARARTWVALRPRLPHRGVH